MAFYPVNLVVTDKVCVIVGGGRVAQRKIQSLLACGARVVVISPQVVAEIQQLAERGGVVWLQRSYRSGDLHGAFLVFATTDNPEVQRQVAAEAAAANVLLNIADAPSRCDFQVPAAVRRGDLLLTVSTGGASPALSRSLKGELAREYGDDYQAVVALFARVREVVVRGSANSDNNKALFEDLLNRGIVDATRRQDWSTVSAILRQVLPPGCDVEALVAPLHQA